MIRQTDIPQFGITFLDGYLASYYRAYGSRQPFLRFFTDENGGILALMDGVATTSWHDDTEELQWFLRAQGDIHTVRAAPSVAEELSKSLGGNVQCRPVMRCEVAHETNGSTVMPSLRKLYPLLDRTFESFPSFDNWYVDVSHRVRHDCCHICGVEYDGQLISSAMTVAEWGTGAVIGSVATDSEYRGHGYASQCVTELAAFLQQQRKTVFICPKNETAQRLYERLGFSVCGQTAVLERI